MGIFVLLFFVRLLMEGSGGSEYWSELCPLLTFWARTRLIVEVRVVKYVGLFWLCRLACKRHTPANEITRITSQSLYIPDDTYRWHIITVNYNEVSS
jgi:hypothetical protein